MGRFDRSHITTSLATGADNALVWLQGRKPLRRQLCDSCLLQLPLTGTDIYTTIPYMRAAAESV